MPFLKDINLDRFKNIVTANYAFGTRAIDPFLKPAAEKYVIPFIGAQLFDDIKNLYDANEANINALTPFQLLMIERVEAVLYNYAAYMAVPFINVQISSAGITQQHTDKSKPAFHHATTAVRQAFIDLAYDAIEQLIQFCEDNIIGLSSYAASAEHLENKSTFIYSARQFENCYPVLKRWQTFYSLIPAIKDIEKFVILKNIGQSYFDDLKTKILSNTLTNDDELVLKLIQNCVANYAIERGLLQNWVGLLSDGVVFSEYAATFANIEERKTATPLSISNKIRDARDMAERYLSELLKLLNENLTTYSLYKDWLDILNTASNTTTATDGCCEFEAAKVCCKTNKRTGGMIW